MNRKIHKLLVYFSAAVWLVNGLFCKVLNLVPRHEEIVRRILGGEYSAFLTRAIGTAEIFMAIWILIRFMPRFNALTQIIIVAVMNIIEFILVPDLLLWGKLNALLASLFIALIGFNEFYLTEKS